MGIAIAIKPLALYDAIFKYNILAKIAGNKNIRISHRVYP